MEWSTIEAKIEQAAQQEAVEAQRQISERKKAHRERQRRRERAAKAVGITAALALSFTLMASAATSGSRKPEHSAPSSSTDGPDPPAAAESYAPPATAPASPPATAKVTVPPVKPELEPIVETTAPVAESAEPEAPEKILDSVPLDAETQAAIFDLCGQDPELFAAIMAIAEKESGFDTGAVGDSGRSIGMMQINTRWNTDRMAALGVTDLTDPVQCVTVALDVLRELSDLYGFGWVTGHQIYMGYNMGPGNAGAAIRNGATSSAYSRDVLAAFNGYLEEMEGTE